ncbi:HAD-IA family hydrolase [Silvibacterium dinghuense]|uniref:HAD family hydrolase n=1 Tax=Silvibacterium dinghuense TaxID=1560006 RepID=A0A4Q1SC78_9BACT|nr:HAD-IA family hydrolase [Silvibacterium dinghuense]RXS94420.1 HAD family hydrolase [Silvibacterium dinghuense]GGH16232.1 haloacid dehalogenase [Silvibacterium dinghuense]
MKIQVRGILFDMDGILVSSLGSVERSWAKWGEMRGVDGATAIKTAHGQRAIDTIKMLRPDLDAQKELDVVEEIEIADKDDIKILPGVKALLAALPKDRWTIATSATKKLAKARLGYAGITPPEQFISADMVTHGKPNPEPYQRGAAVLGFAPEECLVIEDAPAGAKAGHAAGCKVMATMFSHSVEQLEYANWIVTSLEDVKVQVLEDGLELEFEPVPRTVAEAAVKA